jgi:hypothetical protein
MIALCIVIAIILRAARLPEKPLAAAHDYHVHDSRFLIPQKKPFAFFKGGKIPQYPSDRLYFQVLGDEQISDFINHPFQSFYQCYYSELLGPAIKSTMQIFKFLI